MQIDNDSPFVQTFVGGVYTLNLVDGFKCFQYVEAFGTCINYSFSKNSQGFII